MNKTKRNKIIYWVSTIWLSLGMLSSGIVQLLKMQEEIEFVLKLGLYVLKESGQMWGLI